MFHDVIQRIYTDDGNGDGRITPAGLEAFELITYVGRGGFDYGIPELDQYPGWYPSPAKRPNRQRCS